MAATCWEALVRTLQIIGVILYRIQCTIQAFLILAIARWLT